MNRQTPKSLHKHYNFLLVIVSQTPNGCYDIVQSLLHRDMRKNSEWRSQGWNTIFELPKPCFVLAEVQSERQRQRLESIYAHRDRESLPGCLIWYHIKLDNLLITYLTNQLLYLQFRTKKKSRNKCSLDICIYRERERIESQSTWLCIWCHM